jgi:hypothetical protein
MAAQSQQTANTKLERAQECVAEHMDAISTLFISGVKVTVIVRTPDFPDRDFMMTSDDLREVIALIERRLGEVT